MWMCGCVDVLWACVRGRRNLWIPAKANVTRAHAHTHAHTHNSPRTRRVFLPFHERDVTSEHQLVMFRWAPSFHGDISKWDVSSVSTMSYMFDYATFSGDISAWDVSSVKDMSGMLVGTDVLTGDISKWDVSSVTTMSYMFAYTNFNGDISKWDVSSLTDMSGMFLSTSAFNSDISRWEVGRLERDRHEPHVQKCKIVQRRAFQVGCIERDRHGLHV